MKLSATLFATWAALALAQTQTCTSDMVASDDCAAVIDANACYNELSSIHIEMPQTVYRRPWPSWLILATSLPLSITWIVLIFVQGGKSVAALFVGATDILVLLVFSILDPEFTITSRKALPDGTVVNVRRPIIGFKHLESPLGVTGGYEVRIDGFRYEPAYIRI
ncbi:hypothetical protein F5Y03DRAFT_398967 [Xylaria venustula]|nr:hypothetical protein F5Y03DRAFT_398967 [Xylaria venustula]